MPISGGFFKGSGDMAKSTYDPNDDGVIAVAQTEADMKETVYKGSGTGIVKDTDKFKDTNFLDGRYYEKEASANLRNSHDAPAENDAAYVSPEKLKTFTLTHGIKGTLTVKFDIKREAIGCTVYGWVRKGEEEDMGAEQSSTSDAYETKSQNIAFGEMNAGDVITLYGSTNHPEGGKACMVRNFRLYYDNKVVGTAVAATTS